MFTPKSFLDGITSLTNKLANARNPHRTNTVSASRIGWEEMRSIYRSGMGSKIYRLKSGIALNDTLVFESVADKEFYDERLGQVVKDATKQMLGFGRGLVVIFELGEDLSSKMARPPSPERMRIRSFSGDMVFISQVNLDLSSPDYLKPKMYSVRGQSIHPSRCVDFTYVAPAELELPEYQYGGISEAELIRNELVSDQVVQRAVPAILEKSSTMFYKVDGFKELLASNQESVVVDYFAALESLRSIYGAGIIDNNDAVEVFSQALTNLAESDMITLRRIAMVTGLPLSWLVGEAARGLNATGEGERQVMMQTIMSLQSDYLLSPINRLMKITGQGQVKFKENQGERPSERMAYEKDAIVNAQILWSLGEDYEKYLISKGVIERDPIEEFFAVDELEAQDDPDPAVNGGLSLEQLLGGIDEA